MNLDHIFIDIAVTDPDPNVGEILAIAAVRTDRKGKPLAAFSEKTGTSDSFDERRFREAIKGMQDVVLAKSFEMSYIVVAHNADVDRRFLKLAWERVSEVPGEVFPKRAWLDTAQLAWPLVYNDMISERTLDSLCKHFDVKNTAIDTAMGDCEALVRVYWAMMARYRAALAGEEVVRNVGGDTLAKVRKVVGGLF